MPGISSVDPTIVAVRHTIGNPTLETGDASALPHVNNNGLTKTNVKSVPRNQSFSKRNRKGKSEQSKHGHVEKSQEDTSTRQNGEATRFPVLELTLVGGHETSKNIKPESGRNYLENYKAVLKQRGIKYQEIFGHTPRKPDQRVGRMTSKAPVAITPLARTTSEGVTQRSATQGTPVDFQHPKLPGIVTEADLATNADIRLAANGSDAVNMHGKTLSSADYVNSDAFSHGNTIEDDEVMTDRFSDILNGHSGHVYTPRRVKKRGKLGEVMTPKRMGELLETGEPLKMENYYNVYD